MYGLVNGAIRELLIANHGTEVWEEVCKKAGYSGATFLGMESYDDAITYDLVGAAAQTLGEPPADILREFGRYWVKYTTENGYGDLLRLSGKNTADLLENLDNLHSRVGLQYPKLKPPSFHVTDRHGDSLRLHYTSERSGLAPMVEGLVEGLGELFGESVQIRLDRSRDDGEDHDEFLVRIEGARHGSG